MLAGQHQLLRQVEDRHWWYAVLHDQVLRALEERLVVGACVLDVGCGTGGMMSRLPAHWNCLGIDVAPAAVEHTRARGLNALVADAAALPLPDASLDGVLSLDVIYHTAVNPQAAMAEMARVLKPGGTLVLNVAALKVLRGTHDEAVCGARRYNASQVKSLLKGHSLRPDMIHYWNAWLFLPMLAIRLVSRCSWQQRPGSDLWMPPLWANRMLARAGRLDAHMCRLLRVPFGSSVFATATRMSLL